MISDDSLHHAYKCLTRPDRGDYPCSYYGDECFAIAVKIHLDAKFEIEQEMISRKMFTHDEIYGK